MYKLSISKDPIIAISTSIGRAGIGVVRISFGDAKAAIADFMQSIVGRQLIPRQASYVSFRDVENDEILDYGIAVYFPEPCSYTGETVLELQGHGGTVIMQLLIRSCLKAGRNFGLRIAAPGEFTQRAFMNDKLDLAQAEAVADLIEATTEEAARSASRSLIGTFSTRIQKLADELTELQILVETILDFPEERIDFLETVNFQEKIREVIVLLNEIRAEAQKNALLKEGLTVVLAGSPNVGKSSLLNALSGTELSIVTPIPGTTRDCIKQTIQISGIPMHIVDTAGLRETNEIVEKIGVERSWKAIEEADIILYVSEALNIFSDKYTDISHVNFSISNSDITKQFFFQLPKNALVLHVINKIDLTDCLPKRCILNSKKDGISEQISLSALTGAGIDLLHDALLDAASSDSIRTGSILFARERHLQAISNAHNHIERAQKHSIVSNGTLDLLAEELRIAKKYLDQITGTYVSNDILSSIFSRFCIGK